MRKRPWSSVTTTLANFVGRSVVSAITQTPASGPLVLLTTPPRSFAPTLLAPCGVLWHEVRKAAIAIAAAPKCKVLPIFMKSPLDCGVPPLYGGQNEIYLLPEFPGMTY